MDEKLTIVAIFRAEPGREDDLSAALHALIPPTRAEPGCLLYDLHRDLEDPGRFLFYETWETRVRWEAHMESAHIRHHRDANASMIAEAEILQMTRTD